MSKSKIHLKHLLLSVLSVLFISTLVVSCKSAKEIQLLNDLPDSPRVVLPHIEIPDPIIQPDDVLEIKISGAFDQTTKEINSLGGGFASTNVSANYLVDRNGIIEIYSVGKVQAGGLTKDSLRNKLIELLNNKLKNLNVFVRFIGFKYTILGEVRAPGTITTLNDKVTILEAIGASGDLTAMAKRNLVKIIRDSSGYREVGIINLNQKSLFTSPYFYLRRNDVIIVEGETKKKKASESLAKVTSYLGIISSVVALLYIIIKK